MVLSERHAIKNCCFKPSIHTECKKAVLFHLIYSSQITKYSVKGAC